MRLFSKILLLCSTITCVFPVLASDNHDYKRARKELPGDADDQTHPQSSLSTTKADITSKYPNLLKTVEEFPAEKLPYVWNFMQESGIASKYPNSRTLQTFFHKLKEYDQESLDSICEVLKNSSALDKCQNPTETFSIFETLKDYPRAYSSFFCGWMKTSGTMDKCQHGEQINRVLMALAPYYCEERLKTFCRWMETSGAMDKFQNGEEIAYFLSDTSRFDFLRDLGSACGWIKSSGALDKCQTGKHITGLLTFFNSAPLEKLSAACEGIKNTGAIDRCQNGTQIISALNMLCGLANCQLTIQIINLENTGILNYEFFHQCLLICNHGRYSGLATRILEQQPAVDFDFHEETYLACHAYYRANPAVVQAVQDRINDPTRANVLISRVARIFGEEHEFTQNCRQLARRKTH